MTITEKIRKLCEANNITINKLEKELGIGRGNIGRWYKHRPNPDDLLKVANRFNVGAEYLLSDDKLTFDIQFFAEKNPALENENGITDVQKMAIDFIKTLSDEQLERYINMGKAAFGERGI